MRLRLDLQGFAQDDVVWIAVPCGGILTLTSFAQDDDLRRESFVIIKILP